MNFKSSVFLLVFIVNLTGYTQSEMPLKCKAITLKKDTVQLFENITKAHFIILSNKNACRECFRPLNHPSNRVWTRIKENSLTIKFLCRVEKNTSVRRRHINTLKLEVPIFANDSSIFFDLYTDEYIFNKCAKSGVFGQYKVLHTPAAILYEPEFGIMFFPYTVLYGYLKNNNPFSIEGLKEYATNLK